MSNTLARTLASANVVDLGAYREARDRERLPLFDGPGAPGSARTLPGGVRPAPAAPLDGRRVEHRRRMLAHLGAMLSACPT